MEKYSMAEKTLPKPVMGDVLRTIEPFYRLRRDGQGRCSRATRDARLQFFPMMVAQLWMLGFRIRKLKHFGEKHVRALMEYWFQDGITVQVLHTRLSSMNVLLHWMGKDVFVHDIATYLPKDSVVRHSVAKESKAWECNGQEPTKVFARAEEFDARLAVILKMQHYFGLRVKEAIEIHPANAVVEEGQFLEIYEGTKGGRVRRVPIETDEQRKTIELARAIAVSGNNKRLRWPGLTWKQAQAKYYYLTARKLGVNKSERGVTSHGLRHGYAQRGYTDRTGEQPPVRGGNPARVEREAHRDACITVSRQLGHGRTDVTASYYGSFGHKLRGQPAEVAKDTPSYGGDAVYKYAYSPVVIVGQPLSGST